MNTIYNYRSSIGLLIITASEEGITSIIYIDSRTADQGEETAFIKETVK